MIFSKTYFSRTWLEDFCKGTQFFASEQSIKARENYQGLQELQDVSPASHSKSKYQKIVFFLFYLEILFGWKDCDFKFSTDHDLHKHLIPHTGEKPFTRNEGGYKCEECDYKGNLESQLMKHMMSYKKDTVFRFQICIAECNSQRVLEQHLSEHRVLNVHGLVQEQE